MGWIMNQDPFAERKEQGGDNGNRRGRPLGSRDKQPRRRPEPKPRND